MSGLRNRRPPRWLVALVVPALAIVAILVSRTGSSAPPAAATNESAPPTNGITCDPVDHRDTPVTVHLTILVNGKAGDILPNVGFSDALVAYPASGAVVTKADCRYWLHTGRDDGVIHVDPPPASARRAFTLGDFFDVWHQPLGTAAVTSDEGPVTSYVNGQRYVGNPRTIPLTEHAAIQLDIGTDVAAASYAFPSGD